jgi:protein-tyrosine phosphatase
VSNWPSDKKLLDEQFDVVYTVCKKYKTWKVKKHVHMPLHDGTKIPSNLQDVVRSVKEDWLTGQKVLVHCYSGRNRSYLVAVELYASIVKTPKPNALKRIRDIYPGAIKNPVFEKYLNS